MPPARHDVSCRSSSPGVGVSRVRPSCQVSRALARSATTGPGGQPGADRQGWLSRLHPPPMQALARTRPPCERAGRGARPVNRPDVSGPMRGDGPCRAVRGGQTDLSGPSRHDSTPPSGSRNTNGDSGTATCRVATPGGFAGARRAGSEPRGPAPVGVNETPARRKEAVDRITRDRGEAAREDGRVDHEGPDDRAGSITPAPVARRGSPTRRTKTCACGR